MDGKSRVAQRRVVATGRSAGATTVFQALKAPTNSDAETHFADGRLDSLSVDAKLKRGCFL